MDANYRVYNTAQRVDSKADKSVAIGSYYDKTAMLDEFFQKGWQDRVRRDYP
ncbi:hypothetical protein PPRY_b0911 [Pseudoalteromonas prydzensis ACAM 620]|nr:hypothetical protein [Pseudoalteromonas prydzensis ACAM 620]